MNCVTPTVIDMYAKSLQTYRELLDDSQITAHCYAERLREERKSALAAEQEVMRLVQYLHDTRRNV
jgi:hypothetical protein